jgi:hypothetical protein
LQKKLEVVDKQMSEFHSSRNGTMVITKGVKEYHRVKAHFENRNLTSYKFYPKSQKPIKAVSRHMPQNLPAEDMSDGLVDLDFDVINVKQILTARRSPDGTTVTLSKTARRKVSSNPLV